jgi:hypothetical protein
VPVFVALAGLAPAAGCGVVTSAPTASPSGGAGPSTGFGAAGGEVDATSSCHASDVLTYVQGAYQPAATPTGACLGADGGELWDDFYAACLGPDKTNDKCTDFKQTAENAACAACVLTPYTASQLGPILSFGAFVGGNIAGCLELAAPSDPSCPKAEQAQTDCEIAACQANCPVSNPESLQAYLDCAKEADEAGCAMFVQMASACQAAEADAGLAAPCMNGGFTEFYDAVVPLFCGQAMAVDASVAADAGASDASVVDAATVDGGSPAAVSDAGTD